MTALTLRRRKGVKKSGGSEACRSAIKCFLFVARSHAVCAGTRGFLMTRRKCRRSSATPAAALRYKTKDLSVATSRGAAIFFNGSTPKIWPGMPDPVSLLSVLLEEMRNGHDALVVIVE